MSYVRRFTVDITTDAGGGATAFSDFIDCGFLSQIRYVKTDFADGVDFTVTLDKTGEALWSESDVNASATRAPRQPTHSTAGVASLYAATGTAVQDKIAIAADRVKIVVAAGGNAKSGTFHLLIE